MLTKGSEAIQKSSFIEATHTILASESKVLMGLRFAAILSDSPKVAFKNQGVEQGPRGGQI